MLQVRLVNYLPRSLVRKLQSVLKHISTMAELFWKLPDLKLEFLVTLTLMDLRIMMRMTMMMKMERRRTRKRQKMIRKRMKIVMKSRKMRMERVKMMLLPMLNQKKKRKILVVIIKRLRTLLNRQLKMKKIHQICSWLGRCWS